MKYKLWRVPLISLTTGIITSIISFACSYIMAKGSSEWTINMGSTVSWIQIVTAFILFIGTGFMCFKDMSKNEILKSAFIVSIYYGTCLGLEQLFLLSGHYPTVLLILFVPVDVYSILQMILLRITSLSAFVCIIPSILMPLLYTVFSKKENAK